MKKLFCGIALCVMLANMTAYAEPVYNSDNHTLYYDGEGYETILITKENDWENPLNADNILYIDQNNSGFNTAINFLLKMPVEAGTYIVRTGNNGNVITEQFKITEQDVAGEKPMLSVENP